MAGEVLPEVAGVHWRARMDARRLRTLGRWWTATTVAHVVPFIAAALVLVAVKPVLTVPVAILCLVHAWVIPELYAQRGANVVRPRKNGDRHLSCTAEQTAIGLLGDLVDHESRDLHARTGLVLERGRLGAWMIGEAGALLLTSRGRRVSCWCVRVNHPGLPAADRIAHLLLALRADEEGFATVANLAFSGARWRVRRRLPRDMRTALSGSSPAVRGPLTLH